MIEVVENLVAAGMDLGSEEGYKHSKGMDKNHIPTSWGSRNAAHWNGGWCELGAMIDEARQIQPNGKYKIIPPMLSCIPKAMATLVDVSRICTTVAHPSFDRGQFCL